MAKWLFSALIAVLAASTCNAQSPGATLTAPEVKARAIFERLIAFKTSVGLGQVPPMAAYLAGEFRAAGFPEADIHIFPLGETASMVVRYRGDGSGGKPILLMAHMDVVTAKREEWQRDPFALVEENGFFFGRGTFDIKGGLTCETATFLRLKAEGFVPTRDLIIMFTGDEETTENTTADLAKNHRDLINADFALNADAGNATLDETTGLPLFFSLGTAEKSYASYDLTVTNPGGHSSLPRVDNAIYELADALKKVQAYGFPIMWNDTTLGYFKGIGKLTPGPLGQAMQQFGANPHDQKAGALLAQSPTYVGMTRTTCVPTLLRGGHAENALPESATVTINCR
ncbi:MAG TPA: M20/M25/M40 family metallo-hydrolase, partial [Candidatus Solibacter sp.]|nr:M20/M25/M40 family metallo-hydrolase [Candidatus Solibacter sp.]